MLIMKTDKEIQHRFLKKMAEFNYPKWVAKKNNQYFLNLSMAGISHVAKGLTDLTLAYAGRGENNWAFLNEVMKDSLIGAFTTADAVSIQGMAIYIDFVYHVVPAELRIKK